MKSIKLKLALLLTVLMTFSCDDLSDLNENENGIQPEVVNPNLVLPTVLTNTFKEFVKLGYGDVAGVVQHTQLDAWFTGHNDYDWADQSWATYYGILRNNELVYKRAIDLEVDFHQGIALVLKSAVFGLITDLWGDAPYTTALQGDEGNIFPTFDTQQVIYTGIIADLETANTLLSKDKNDYPEITEDVESLDVIYGGDPTLWRKLANSLLLRYFMRISEKEPGIAKTGIEKIVGNPMQYPIITSSDEDAVMDFVGTSADDSWPTAVFSTSDLSNYKRKRMCATLVEALQDFNDPRLAVWAQKIEIPLVVDAGLPAGTDKLVDEDSDGDYDVRQLAPDVVAGVNIDTDPEYVGIPPSVSAMPSAYNLGPNPGQTSVNPHVSYLNEIYSQPSGDILKARLISAAEIHFILAEAALKGWAAGDAKEHYDAAVQASFEAWGVEGDYASYIAQDNVKYSAGDGAEVNLEKIMTQKWIASWTAATEAWFDYRRTGLPAFQAGVAAERNVLPVRFYYMTSELDMNETNAQEALDKLEVNEYSQADGKNSAWSKPWLIQGTGKPWE